MHQKSPKVLFCMTLERRDLILSNLQRNRPVTQKAKVVGLAGEIKMPVLIKIVKRTECTNDSQLKVKLEIRSSTPAVGRSSWHPGVQPVAAACRPRGSCSNPAHCCHLPWLQRPDQMTIYCSEHEYCRMPHLCTTIYILAK